ncbi:MAG TPA: CHASE2 domain-containing protein, partial [Clostridia bacterium]|nr:CHASE2 domain-containing protein [Clostridia bacterium]
MKLKPFKRVPGWIALGVISLVCLVHLLKVDFFERLEHITYDMRVRQALHTPLPLATNLGFVFIDEESIRAVGSGALGYKFGLYWPRQVYGRVVRELADQGANMVAFDVIFGELRADHPPVQLADGGLMDSDDFFAQQLFLSSNVIMAVTREVMPPPLFLTNAIARGDISTDKDPDGILRRARAFRTYRHWHPLFRQAEADADLGIDLRRVTIQPDRLVLHRTGVDDISIPLDAQGRFALADFVGDSLPPGTAPTALPFTTERIWHMGIVLAARELGLKLEDAEVDLAGGKITLRGGGVQRAIPVDADGSFYLDWCLPPNHPQLTQEPIHAVLLQSRARAGGATNLGNLWRGKLAVVGSSAMGNDLTDRGATPLRADTLLVSKHWNVANSVITGRFVQRAGLALDLLIIALLGAAAALLTWRFRALVASSLVLLLAAGYVLFGTILYLQTRFWIPLALPVLGSLFVTHVCLVTWRVIFEQTEKRRVRSIFSTIVSPKIVQELLQSEKLALGGARRQITVMFADVRGFT